MKKIAVFLVIIAIAGVGAWLLLQLPDGDEANQNAESEGTKAQVTTSVKGKNVDNPGEGAQAADDSSNEDDGNGDAAHDAEGESESEMTPEERREAEEEKAVDTFDALTDKWMEPSGKGVTMEEIKKFGETFKKVPKSRKDECIHRALNLVPDDNVMLLAGILLDKTYDKEIIETVFNDILNRDESVKKPIMKEIFKDKSHPCWADVAWILDVTGELPKSK